MSSLWKHPRGAEPEKKHEWPLIIKKLNQFTKIDNYFLPNKDVLINLVRNKKYFSKFGCKFEISPYDLTKGRIIYRFPHNDSDDSDDSKEFHFFRDFIFFKI